MIVWRCTTAIAFRADVDFGIFTEDTIPVATDRELPPTLLVGLPRGDGKCSIFLYFDVAEFIGDSLGREYMGSAFRDDEGGGCWRKADHL